MKKIIIKLLVVTEVISLLGMSNFACASTLSELQKQKEAAAQAAANAKAAAEQKAAEAAAINTQINEIQKQIDEAQASLDDTNNNITNTERNIADLTNQIKTQQDNLNAEQDKIDKVVAAWYMEGDNSGLFNALINSNTLSGVITSEEYYDSVRQQIELTMDKISKLKSELEAKKADQDNKKMELVKLQQEQKSELELVSSRMSQKNKMLNYTLSQKENYLDQVEKLKQEISSISDEIYAERQRLAKSSKEKYLNGSSGYPFSSIDEPDPWMFLTRECTSYAAWYWNVMEGKTWYNTRPGSGSAWNWPALAADQGYSVSSTPRIGAIVSWRQTSSMPYGHVAIVENVNNNGTIDLSEYNWIKYSYSYRVNVDPGYYGSYSYIY